MLPKNFSMHVLMYHSSCAEPDSCTADCAGAGSSPCAGVAVLLKLQHVLSPVFAQPTVQVQLTFPAQAVQCS